MKQDRLTPSFTEKCYQLVARIPHGKVTTYKLIANALGSSAYRAVGTAMKNNPHAPKVPCHRVIATNGALGGYAHGAQKKAALLRAEGIVIRNGHICNLEQVLWQPSKHR